MGFPEDYCHFFKCHLVIIIYKKNHMIGLVDVIVVTSHTLILVVRCYDTEQTLDERERHPINNRDKHDV